MKDSVRYWSVPGNKTRWRTSSKYVDIQSRFRKCARSFDFCDESSLVIQCWTWSAWTCVFVFYLLVGWQTMIRDWYGAFLRILKLSTFFLEKVYSHWKWFPLYCLSVERHCFRKLRLKRRKYICKVLLIRRQQTISSRAPLCKIVLGQSAHFNQRITSHWCWWTLREFWTETEKSSVFQEHNLRDSVWANQKYWKLSWQSYKGSDIYWEAQAKRTSCIVAFLGFI